ncbi:hypothetical protein FIBSPDRAFT_494806 [Athelia psychrophila]|uniref:F-box domain-containing protein n=1 Tax=Athelia psychrophila TaxID=1759441 RepID=A0A166KI46_9AGAM|nr:hypothetical protein FIBSPDRAFT_494806 [Fibularhizoctonia sp. CBS 109695]
MPKVCGMKTQKRARLLLGTNAVPSEDQKVAIKNILAQRAQSWILVASRSSWKQAPTDQLAALITPARALFPEIVSVVFESCILGQMALPRPLVHKAPLVLTQICSKWRRIAIDSTPKVQIFQLI